MTRDISSLTTPRFLSLESPTTAPNIPARMGPISGEISMLATRVTLLDSTEIHYITFICKVKMIHFIPSPMKAMTEAKMRSMRKSNVK